MDSGRGDHRHVGIGVLTLSPLGQKIASNIVAKLDDTTTKSSSCSIFKVRQDLREGNEATYEPCIVAIGPYQLDKKKSLGMEHKKRYLQKLLERNELAFRDCVDSMVKLENKTRECYADEFKICTEEFVEMMLRDGCFIVELLRRYTGVLTGLEDSNGLGDKERDSLTSLGWMTKKLASDLLLVENQLPFFVLDKLYRKTKTSKEKEANHHLQDMILYFFATSVLLPIRSPVSRKQVHCSTKETKHLLSLVHEKWCQSTLKGEVTPPLDKYSWFKLWAYPNFTMTSNTYSANGRRFQKLKSWIWSPYKNKDHWRYMRCATELKEAGIEFKKIQGDSLFDIKFEKGILKIPRLEITGETESIFRNLIVYEEFSPSENCEGVKLVGDYMRFMDCLINSQKDVELLCRRNILHNCLGDDEMAASMFNRLGDFVTIACDNYYFRIFCAVNKHCGQSRHRWTAYLRHNYFNTPWAFISFFAAVLLLILTLAQTVYSVLSYNK